MRITLSDEAKADGRDAVEWYIDEGAFPAVNAFADELEHTLHLLRQFPEMGTPSPDDTRMLPLRAFPYSLVYRIHTSVIRVIAIAHHSRRPGYWAGRR
ncbi:MAG: type II toxin-antitoxin system RelE/ParE family toxin [Gammaproteobacteria bacterium]|nr:type II toxin-antitoxin system RelE/ParE family toxin [Gammaproteobacteria bacterium]